MCVLAVLEQSHLNRTNSDLRQTYQRTSSLNYMPKFNFSKVRERISFENVNAVQLQKCITKIFISWNQFRWIALTRSMPYLPSTAKESFNSLGMTNQECQQHSGKSISVNCDTVRIKGGIQYSEKELKDTW
ncbi:hypothetical protein AVEN_34943-1 [Araneus ventricosus]|uniref:Uncharacterized protein n=1 Tax=Araneus ventricosus TaxID=182803 RepID=A0A4Y2GBD7_ARAVE|nr:hypothetical protein AVEN_34943-1 [Araneus ventricosus]